MNKKYICVTDLNNLQKIIKNQIWGVKNQHKKQIENLNIGDILVFYIKAGRWENKKIDSSIFGIYEVIGNIFHDKTNIFSIDEEVFPNRVKIQEKIEIEKPKNFRPLIPKLNLIKNKKRWGCTFMGRSMIQIEDHDFEIILNYLK